MCYNLYKQNYKDVGIITITILKYEYSIFLIKQLLTCL